MLIFALDSTAVAASVALRENGRTLAAFHLENGNTHSETLLPMAESLFRVTGRSVSDVDLFACAVGPGSFTGVRIGAATVKGLAFGKNKPCAAVSTLEALAENAMPTDLLVCPVMNARRAQVYNALFRRENGVLTRLCPDRALSVSELETELEARGEPFLLVGDGAALVRDALTRVTPVPLSPLLVNQNAASVAACAERAFARGEVVTDAALTPTYLRMPQAERERLAREQAKN